MVVPTIGTGRAVASSSFLMHIVRMHSVVARPSPPRRLLLALGVVGATAASPRPGAAQTGTTQAGALPSGQSGDVRSLSAGRVGAQLATGVALGPIGYVGGGLVTRFVLRRLGASQGTASTAAERAAYVGIALATAAGPALIGARGPGHGAYLGALGGATVGMFGTAIVARLNRTPNDRPDPPCRLVCRLSAVAAFTLPSIGATLGYNVTRKR